MKEYFQIIKSNKSIQLLLIAGFIIQLIFCITAVGYFHPDQHFQIIEFSSFQLNKTNAASTVWELEKSIRPTIQVYIFSGFRILCEFININDPFKQQTILRFIQGISLFLFLNYTAFLYFKKELKTLITVLLLINFTWILPYTRTIFSSEMFSVLFFFPAIVFFHKHYLNKSITPLKSILVGVLVAISFYIRFQLGFAILGFGIWLLCFEKQYKQTLYITIGFLIGVCINLLLDYSFYHKIVFTPYVYFQVNILQGVASSFGEKSFTYYLGVLLGVTFVPPISILLLYQYFKISFQKINHPIIISLLFFIVGHFLIAHKEERFLFTIINLIPFVLAFGGFKFLYSEHQFKKYIKILLSISLVLNFALLILFIITPYSQSVHFLKSFKQYFKQEKHQVYYHIRKPIETESKLPLTYYSSVLNNIEFINLSDSTNKNAQPEWLVSTFNDLRDHNLNPINIGYTPVLYSSTMLWSINKFLQKKNLNSINDIWVLYHLDKSIK